MRWEWEAQWAEEIMDRDPARESELPNMNMAGEDERCKKWTSDAMESDGLSFVSLVRRPSCARASLH